MDTNFAAALQFDEFIVTDDSKQIESVFAPELYSHDLDNFVTGIFDGSSDQVNQSELQNIISELNLIEIDQIEEVCRRILLKSSHKKMEYFCSNQIISFPLILKVLLLAFLLKMFTLQIMQ